MRLLLLLAALQTGCSCWDADLRTGSINLVLDGPVTTTGTAHLRMEAAHLESCDTPTDEHDDSGGRDYSPVLGAAIVGGPADGVAIRLAPQPDRPGIYVAESEMPYADTYRFTIDGAETIDALSPRYFTVTVAGSPPTLTLVDGDNKRGDRWTSYVVYAPDGTRGVGHSILGTTEMINPDHYDQGPGTYRVELSRSDLTSDPDDSSVGATIQLTRVVTVQIGDAP
jgi:hypothetical protein